MGSFGQNALPSFNVMADGSESQSRIISSMTTKRFSSTLKETCQKIRQEKTNQISKTYVFFLFPLLEKENTELERERSLSPVGSLHMDPELGQAKGRSLVLHLDLPSLYAMICCPLPTRCISRKLN